jgi:hypothetical protein
MPPGGTCRAGETVITRETISPRAAPAVRLARFSGIDSIQAQHDQRDHGE